MRLKFILSFYLLLLFSLNLSALSGITDSSHRGRFGDCLLSYMKIKWLAYKKNMKPFYYPFAYSDSLTMRKLEPKYTAHTKNNFKRVIRLRKNNFSSLGSDSSALYITNYYLNLGVNADFNDEIFIKELKKMIAPIKNIPKHDLPADRISVAVHIRKGGGFDKPLLSESSSTLTDVSGKQHDYVDVGYPLKFPPDEFYIDQIKVLFHTLGGIPLYIHIFTDDKNPLRIAQKYEQALDDLDIVVSCRESGNTHNANVIEDFFAMNQYDCLIRSASNFSYCADIIGDFFISIYPEHGFWKSGKLIMDDIRVKVNPKSFCKIARFFEDDSFLNTLLKEPNVRTKM